MKKVVIIGASSGIGEALAYNLRRDHRLFLGARRLDRIAKVAGHCSRQENWARYATVNIAKEASVVRFFDAVKEQFEYIDALIITAANQGPIGPAHEGDARAWVESIRANLFGPFFIVHHAVPFMSPGSRVVLFAGGGAFSPRPRFSAYAVAKAGIVRLAETLAEELAPLGITVNAVSPGYVKETEIHKDTPPDLLVGKPVPIEVPVKCVRWMLSAEGMTGKTISASFDPWDQPDFIKNLSKDLYTMQRINPCHLEKQYA